MAQAETPYIAISFWTLIGICFLFVVKQTFTTGLREKNPEDNSQFQFSLVSKTELW